MVGNVSGFEKEGEYVENWRWYLFSSCTDFDYFFLIWPTDRFPKPGAYITHNAT